MNQHSSDNISKEENNKHSFEIPKASKWFKMEEIHEIEMHSLPEFFKGKYASKTPEIYKEYRNYIMNLFRENPNSYLTATS
jgi:SWI/SNF related-matrix-associated actin-dependent regulator of chromatin subfamily C